MKFGLRMPSLKKRISARTSLKRIVRHRVGLKMPRGTGFITNPKKFAYNKVYNKTSFSADRLLRSGNNKTAQGNVANSNAGNCLLIGLSIILLISFWPIGLALIVYLIVKAAKKGNIQSSGAAVDPVVSENPMGIMNRQNDNSIKACLNIPEPTKSLLWVTNENVSKIESATSYKITVEISNDGIKTSNNKDNPNLFSEPSLIWTQLPVEPNEELEESPMYYPSYSNLSPAHRFQYINWLKDVTKETNLSYVFLYFYGLERHLLVGNYDLAVDEILRLIKYHDKGTFKSYAIHSLIAGSVFRKMPDIVDRAPFVLDDMNDMSLALKLMRQQNITARDVISLSSRVGFPNKRYIKLYPDLFEKELQARINEYENTAGSIFSQFNLNSSEKDEIMAFANLSIPDDIRRVKFPKIIENNDFKGLMKKLLTDTHAVIRENKIK